MLTLSTILLFIGTASMVAIMPGPGLFYIAGRTLAGGRNEGIASILGTTLGDMVHVTAGALGVSALVMTSVVAFTALKIVGGAYLIWLGVRTWRHAGMIAPKPIRSRASSLLPVLRQGFVVEVTNPKAAAFFLALIPQFVDPGQDGVIMQFVVLGAISIALNTATGLLVVALAVVLQGRTAGRPGTVQRLQQGSGAMLAALGVMLLAARRQVA